MKTYISIGFIFAILADLNGCHTSIMDKHLLATSAEANNRMILVNDDVHGLGQRRLQALARTYPTVSSFLDKTGRPGFFAERIDRDDHMIAFYYPKDKKAYACRYALGSNSVMEFSGPFPITQEEMEMLRQFENRGGESFAIKPIELMQMGSE